MHPGVLSCALPRAQENAPLLIVAIGSQPDALEGVDVPKNARCFPYLPQVEARFTEPTPTGCNHRHMKIKEEPCFQSPAGTAAILFRFRFGRLLNVPMNW